MSTSFEAPVPFVGIGTGRCGTNSLAKIVGACLKCEVGHEKYQIPWYQSGHENLGRLIRDMRQANKNEVMFGEVGQCLLPHVGELRSAVRNLKVVCLHRDRASTVESFMAFGSFMLRPHDKRKWADGCYDSTPRQLAPLCFPLIDAASAEQAFGFYWDFYEKVMATIPDPVLHMQTEDFNDDSQVGRLFDFLEIPSANRLLIDRRKWYTRDEVAKIRRKMADVRIG